MDDEFVLPELWHDLRGRTVEDAERRARLEDELRREVAPGHVLAAEAVTAVAACTHCDDVVYRLDASRYAVVHLSHPGDAPDRPPWPRTKVLGRHAAIAYIEGHE